MFGFRLHQEFSYDFTVSSKDADLVLLFMDGPLHINCIFLFFDSAYFYAIKERLLDMEKDSDGFPFEDIDGNLEEFKELMDIVYPSEREVTDENVSYILLLANRFSFDGVLKRAEQFLMSNSSEINIFETIYWASESNMTDLKDWCFSQFESREQLKAVNKTEVYKKLKKSANVMAALWEKLDSLPE